MLYKAQRNSGDIDKFCRGSRAEPGAEAQLEKTACNKEEKSNTMNAHKIGAYESQRMPYQRKRQTKTRRECCRPWTQFYESLQFGSHADAYTKSNEQSRRMSGSGQGMGKPPPQKTSQLGKSPK